MALENLRQFIKAIEQVGELVRVTHPSGHTWRSPRSPIAA